MMGLVAGFAQYSHPVQAERLNRGALAVKASRGIIISWRSLVSDDPSMGFNIYREGVKVNATPLTSSTTYVDLEGKTRHKYVVKCVVGGQEVEETPEIAVWSVPYKKIHLDRPQGGTSPSGGKHESREYTYTPSDISVGDVDGDGEYEYILKWFPTNAADNSHFRYTGNTLIDCYKLDGTRLWRIDLGQNIRSGNHYTQFIVYDFDGDGKAEMICKTAPGTIDGAGNAVLMGTAKVTDDYRTKSGNYAGTVMSGPEYLTVFNGMTGEAVSTIAYNPPRSINTMDKNGWGDDYANRSDRYLAGVAYLDGEHPSALFCRGYYRHAYVWAVDFDGTQLTERWLHSSDVEGEGLWGEGTHSLSVADVDGDGCDELIFGAACLDHDGTVRYRTGGGHGDALHVADMLPGREGLEVFMPFEGTSSNYLYDTMLRDAATGEVIYSEANSGKDIGRGIAANISSKYDGYEFWSATKRVFGEGRQLSDVTVPSMNFRIYWDGDPLDELLSDTKITKPNEDITEISTLFDMSLYSNAASCNSTKATPNLQADLFGDWREEVILHDGETMSDLIIFTTMEPTGYKVPCLMQDRQYREAIAWQNVAYNQPPHLSYNLEEYCKSQNSGATRVEAENAPAEYYNLNGMKVGNGSLAPGIYVVRRGSKTSKLVVK